MWNDGEKLELVCVFPEISSLAQAAAETFVGLAEQALARSGNFYVALSGGSSPKALYCLLSGPDYVARLDWQRTHIFWGDERCVPPDHADSNYHMAWESLLRHVPIPAGNIHRMRGEIEPQAAAQEYEVLLRTFFAQSKTQPGSGTVPENRGPFDLILLGLGADGHTASLFPGSPTLDEQGRWVLAVEHTTPPSPLVNRLTLTLPAINAAKWVLFLVAGKEKAEAVRLALRPSESGAPKKPAQLVRPASGNILWLLDQAAWSG
jgi:6-phosphogluconolactonase